MRGLVAGGLLLVWLGVRSSDASSSDEAAVLATLHAACAAFQEGDVARLEKLLSPDFTLTDSAGKVTGREANLAEVRAREPRYDVFRNHHMTVRLHGNAAVVTGITSVKGRSMGQPFESEFQFTDTLIGHRGVWVLVASHASRIAK